MAVPKTAAEILAFFGIDYLLSDWINYDKSDPVRIGLIYTVFYICKPRLLKNSATSSDLLLLMLSLYLHWC